MMTVRWLNWQPMQPDGPAALDGLRERILAIDSEVHDLITQRQTLVAEYERVRFALMGWPPGAVPPGAVPPGSPPYPLAPPPAPAPQEWSGARVRGLLLGLGAALLAISALAFTAVAWSRLGEGGRALLLLTMTALVTGLAAALRRCLPASAEALAGLAVVLVLVDVYALRRAGVAAGMSWQVWWAIGTAVAAGFAAALSRVVGGRTTRLAVAALAPASVELLAGRITGPQWLGAMAFAALAALLVFAVALGRRLASQERLVLSLHAVGCWLAAAMLTVAAGEGALTAGVLAGAAVVLASLVGPATVRGPLRTVGAGLAAPGTAAAVVTAVPSVVSPLAWLDHAWTGHLGMNSHDAAEGPGTASFLHASWPAVGSLLTLAAVGMVLGIRDRRWLGLTTAAMAFAAALAPPTAGAPILVALIATTAVAVLALLLTALIDLGTFGVNGLLLPGAAIAAVPAAGWAAVSPGASVGTLSAGAAAAAAATLITRPVPRARWLFAALTAVLTVILAGVATRAAGAALPAAGFAAALAAGAALLAGVYLIRGTPDVGVAVEAAAALCAGTALAVAADSAAWLAGALTALVPVAAIAARRPDRRLVYAAAAGMLALGAVWAWLSAAHVHVAEAYTAPAAVAALAAGLLGRRGGRGRSWVTVGPALVLAIGPTLVLGMADDDALRLVIAAVLSFAAVVAGALLRLQAPLGIGAAALLILAVDQWGDEIIALPRWITLGVIGVALMWIGATFEHRRRDWRRAAGTLSRYG